MRDGDTNKKGKIKSWKKKEKKKPPAVMAAACVRPVAVAHSRMLAEYENWGKCVRWSSSSEPRLSSAGVGGWRWGRAGREQAQAPWPAPGRAAARPQRNPQGQNADRG